MRKLIVALTLLAGCLSWQVSAESTLTFNKEIGPLVLNGDEVATDIFSSPSQLTLKAGTNQVLFALGQLVVEDGRRTKFNSVPFILRFNAPSDDVVLSYQPFRTMEEAKKFDNDPRFVLKSASGEMLPFQLESLHVNGMQGMKNYEKAVRKYNQKGSGIAVISMEHATTAPVPSVKPKTVHSASSQRAILEAGFHELSAQEQQAFMMWAMKNLKNAS
ncbi:YccT family protein [Photobacterium kagoshimensis]|uniref:YccT family protein n=1 Tax=Photobacterium kagoshimensis TaxID=2910242 RepID=UPI003D134E0F